jgi:hypothetical protein
MSPIDFKLILLTINDLQVLAVIIFMPDIRINKDWQSIPEALINSILKRQNPSYQCVND